jgi:hypothetical protein
MDHMVPPDHVVSFPKTKTRPTFKPVRRAPLHGRNMVITEGSINFQGTTRGSMVIVTKIYLQPTGTLQPFTECIFLGARFAPAVCQGTHLGQIGPTIRVMGWYGCGPV